VARVVALSSLARDYCCSGEDGIQGNTFDTIVKPESFSLLYLNPLYDSEIGTIANRGMEAVFLEHTYRWLRMDGVLILYLEFPLCLAESISQDRSRFGPVQANWRLRRSPRGQRLGG